MVFPAHTMNHRGEDMRVGSVRAGVSSAILAGGTLQQLLRVVDSLQYIFHDAAFAGETFTNYYCASAGSSPLVRQQACARLRADMEPRQPSSAAEVPVQNDAPAYTQISVYLVQVAFLY